tara:strand:+ start:822 stop:1031 length:210 start_codon:yes stop_codon:yes gene_type:complete
LLTELRGNPKFEIREKLNFKMCACTILERKTHSPKRPSPKGVPKSLAWREKAQKMNQVIQRVLSDRKKR